MVINQQPTFSKENNTALPMSDQVRTLSLKARCSYNSSKNTSESLCMHGLKTTCLHHQHQPITGYRTCAPCYVELWLHRVSSATQLHMMDGQTSVRSDKPWLCLVTQFCTSRFQIGYLLGGDYINICHISLAAPSHHQTNVLPPRLSC